MKKPNFEFYVLNYDHNKSKVVNYNIFNNIYVYEKTLKLCEAFYNDVIDSQELTKKLDEVIKYEEWCRCEYEVLVGGLSVDSVNELEKWNCYAQAHANIEIIAQYCIDTYGNCVFGDYCCNEDCFCEDDCCCDDCVDKDTCPRECDKPAFTQEYNKCDTYTKMFKEIADILNTNIYTNL